METHTLQPTVAVPSYIWESHSSPSTSTKTDLQKRRSVGFWELFCFADNYDYFLMAVGTVGAVGHGLAYPAFFYIFGKLVNSMGQGVALAKGGGADKLTSQVTMYSLDIVYLGLVIWVCAWAEVACWMQTGQRQANRLRMAYMNAILIQDIGFFDTDLTTGMLVQSMSADTVVVQDAISEKLGNLLHFIATSVGGFLVGFSAVWSLCLVTIAVVPAIAVAGGFYAFAITQLTSDCQDAYRNAGTIAEETISQIRTVFSFTGEKRAAREFKESLEQTLKLGYKGGLAKGLGLSASYSIVFFSWALIMWYGGMLIRKGQTDGGHVTTAVFAAIIGGMALGQAISNLSALARGKASAYNILQLVNRKSASDHCSCSDGGSKLAEVRGDVELRGVVFNYPSRPDAMIFKNLSLRIPSGRTVALVGGSGSGKSTVISLIERFYDPLEGQILLDGVDIRSLSLKWLRDQIGLVNQEPALFATSIAGNILYGKEDATAEEVEAAARAANAHDFITQLPNSYQTHVGEHGVQLSGGQKQRVAIARAMLKNPKLLLLDEATSALDAASEKVVQDTVDRLMVGRTTVVVAHRLSTIQNVDTIAVMQNGEIVEMGTHGELLSKGDGGPYSTLIRMQELALASDGTILCSSSTSTMIKASSGRMASSSFRRLSSSGSLRFSNVSSVEMIKDVDGEGNVQDEPETTSIGQQQWTERPSTSMTSGFYCWWRLAKINAPEWPYALLGTLGAMFAGALNPVFALVISKVLKLYFEPDMEKMKRGVQTYSIAIVGLGAAALFIYVLQHYYFGVVGENLTARVREMMFRAMLRNEVAWFDMTENNSRKLLSHLTTDAAQVRAAVGDRMSLIVQNVTVCVTAFVVGFILEWRLTLLLLSAYPILVTAAVSQHFCIKGFSGDLNRAHSRCSMIAGDAISNIRTVAAFNAEARVLSLFAASLAGPDRRSFKRGHISGSFLGASQFAMYATYALLFWYGASLITRGTTDFGRVLEVFMVLMMTSFAIAETLSLTPDAAKGAEALRTVLQIIDRKADMEEGEEQEEAGELIVRGEVEMEGVEFAYPSRPAIAILRGLDLRVAAGKSVALVGASGAGKSSVLAMVERFYDPAAGRVKIDGRDIRTVRRVELRRRISLVPQEPALFARTVYSNIAYGRIDGGAATQAEVEAAAKAANAHSFICALPQGYSTQVGERGVQLSGGQKQRLAIARAVLKDPVILLLDEATSALDSEAEVVVQAALERVMRRRTTILVAHRLSTIMSADTVAVLHQGRIVEHGTHSHLLRHRPQGPYARLIAAQFPSARRRPP